MVEFKDGSRRLYLAKGDTQDIHIDASIPLHQIEGIRFLYRIFAKKKPGVILNDPSGYGNRVQTVLFLNAVRPLLAKPILVLCKEGNEEKWLRHFHKWTQLGKEVSVQLCNPPVLKWWVCINPTRAVGTFSRREWGAVVVDDSVGRELLRADIHAGFKLWLTRVDMKKNLQTFSLIYKWIYPKGKFNVEDYQTTNKKPSVVHAKSIILDAFMEDIVIRRKADSLTFRNKNDAVHTTPKVTRKNKDATGMKIKRTKRSHEDIPSELTINVPAKVAKDVIENLIFNLNNSTSSDVKSDDYLYNLTPNSEDEFIQNNEDISNEIENVVRDDRKLMELDENLTLNCEDEVIQSNEIIKESKSNEIEKDVKDNKKSIEADEINYMQIESELVPYNLQESCELLNNIVSSQDIIIKYDSDTPDIDGIKSSKSPEKFNIDKINGTDGNLFSSDVHKFEDSDTNCSKKNAENISDEVICDNGKSQCDEITSKHSPSAVKSDNKNKDELGVSENKTVPELNGIELKIKQLEELSMKKFKGSLLDSIF